jgi:putative SOS response-associated peptidase YedK
MCTNYRPSSRDLVREMLQLGELPDDLHWKAETWKDYPAPIVRKSDTGRDLRLATFGMVPRKRIPQGVKVFDTMNARFETVGEKRSFSGAWKRSQHCLVPMAAFYEPCYESGKAVRWGIGMSDESMFAVAGLWREWEAEGALEYSFTQLTINADDHPLMKRFHKPGDEKRAMVIMPPSVEHAAANGNLQPARHWPRLKSQVGIPFVGPGTIPHLVATRGSHRIRQDDLLLHKPISELVRQACPRSG